MDPAGVVAMRCLRCWHVERVVADPHPPAGSPECPSRYRSLRATVPAQTEREQPAAVAAPPR
ncbi:hypothetical protein [Quadrisphaera granulorum]|uniref:hypothetical protein n=1 Tax=Quadrisphaera granulorum TaxID=317664 RepID=UPI0011B49D73|nr:hypothetical protein [Quadrisphaera granulorum]